MRMQLDEAVAVSQSSAAAELEKRTGEERRRKWRWLNIYVPIIFFCSGLCVELLVFEFQLNTEAEFLESKVSQLEAQVISPELIRDRSKSVLELYAFQADMKPIGYGSAVYLGYGYFLTAKHAVVTLVPGEPEVKYINVVQDHKGVYAEIVDTGDSSQASETDRGDWAVLRVNKVRDWAAARVSFYYPKFGDALFRLGNDFSNGIISAKGQAGPIDLKGLGASLMDAHIGNSGGAVMNHSGELVEISVGALGEDYHYVQIIPLRREMFRKVPHLASK